MHENMTHIRRSFEWMTTRALSAEKRRIERFCFEFRSIQHAVILLWTSFYTCGCMQCALRSSSCQPMTESTEGSKAMHGAVIGAHARFAQFHFIRTLFFGGFFGMLAACWFHRVHCEDWWTVSKFIGMGFEPVRCLAIFGSTVFHVISLALCSTGFYWFLWGFGVHFFQLRSFSPLFRQILAHSLSYFYNYESTNISNFDLVFI